MKRERKNWLLCGRAEAGAGLVEALVSLGLLALVSTVILSKLNNVLKARKHVELKAEIAALKTQLLTSTNCKVIPECQGNQLRSLIDFDSKVLVSANGTTTFGSWTVQARCGADKALEVRVALLNANGNPMKEPLKGTLMDWQAPEGILIERGILCGPTDQGAVIDQFSALVGPLCLEAQGTCPHPFFGAASPMCCDDGSNGVKPPCPSNTLEIASYWDRQDDWGASGQWVVLCRN
jgi:hypothetical protein